MNCRRTSLLANVQKYETGCNLENGFELWSDVVTKGWIETENLIKIERADGTVVCPYIETRRGRIFIGNGDYIIEDEDGSKHVCGEDKIWSRYEKI